MLFAPACSRRVSLIVRPFSAVALSSGRSGPPCGVGTLTDQKPGSNRRPFWRSRWALLILVLALYLLGCWGIRIYQHQVWKSRGADYVHVTWHGSVTKLSFLRLKTVPVEHLKAATSLQYLSLVECKLTDIDLAYSTSLQILWLYRCRLTDADLAHLRSLTNLKELNLSDNGLTDQGLAHLTSLTSLEQLYLHGTQVTDAGLNQLEPLTNLRILIVTSTKVTDEGVDQLRKTLPDCVTFHRNPGPSMAEVQRVLREKRKAER